MDDNSNIQNTNPVNKPSAQDNSSQNPSGQSQGPKSWHGRGYGYGHNAFRIILGIIIVLIVFWLGILVGSMRHPYGAGGFVGRGGGMRMRYNPGSPMIRVQTRGTRSGSASSTAPSVPSAMPSSNSITPQ